MKKPLSSILIVCIMCIFNSCSEDNPADAGMNVGIVGQILNSSTQATILHAELLFDDKVIYSQKSQVPSALVSLAGGVTGVSKGTHTISFRIVSQTTSPSTYEVSVIRVETNDAAPNLFPDKKSMNNGESISVSVDL